MKNLWLLVTLVMCGYAVTAQSRISGKVVDENGDPLFGASVAISGTSDGTITDDLGNFVLSTNATADSVVVSFVGYKSQVLAIQSDFMEITLQNSYELEEVIISTIRAQNDPITYSNVSRKEIQKVYHGEQPIFTLESTTPSMFTYSESGTRVANYGNVRLRGIDQTRINMTLNGIPLNDMIDQGVFFSNFTDIGNSIESVQVQRGVGTSTNGSASYAGSINFESVNLRKQKAGGNLQVGIGSFNTKRLNVSASTGLMKNKWAAYTSFSRLYSDGYRRNTSTNSYSFFMSVGYFGKKDFVKINAFDANARNGLGYSFVLKSDLDKDSRTNYLDPNDKDNFGQQLVQIQHTHMFNSNTSVTSSLYYGYAGGDFLYTDLISNPSYQINYPLQNHRYGAMSNLLWTPTSKLEISAGVHGYLFYRGNQESYAPDFAHPYYNEKSHKDEFSSFAKAKYKLDRLSVYADMQVRTMQLVVNPDWSYIGTAPGADIVKKWTFINPKAGIDFAVNKKLTAYASVGRTGREPTKIDIFAGGFELGANNLAFARSNAFKPEYVNDTEAGIRYLNRNLSLNANVFNMDFKNEIAPYGEVIAFGVQKRVNIPHSYRRGIEVEWKYSPVKQVSFTGHTTYMKAQIKNVTDKSTGDSYQSVSPILTPKWVYGGSINFNPVDYLSFGFNGRGISQAYLEISNDKNMMLPAYFVSGFQADAEFWRIKIKLQVNNLGGKPYYTKGAPVDTNYDGKADAPGYLVNAGRNYYLTTTFNF